jgi:2-enoate reductase
MVECADGEKKLIHADTVVSALGFRPVLNLKDQIKELGLPVCEVGDATGAGTIMKAIWDAYEAANNL